MQIVDRDDERGILYGYYLAKPHLIDIQTKCTVQFVKCDRGEEKLLARTIWRKSLLLTIGVFSAVILLGCGNDGGDKSSGAGGQDTLKATWLYTGPENDGGYNETNVAAMKQTEDVPGVTATGIFDLDYNQRTTQVVRQAIAAGSGMIVDTLGAGEIIESACATAIEDAKCLLQSVSGKVGENVRAFYPKDWDITYVAGVAAGLMTQSGTIGLVLPSKIPIMVTGVNTFTLGCQSVRPDCKSRAIFTDDYFDPEKAAKAANSLINAGADVLRQYVDDPTFCEVAERRGVHAVPSYADIISTCPEATVTSTVWDLGNYQSQQAKSILDGTFTSSGSQPDFIPIAQKVGSPRLGEFGESVPEDVVAKVKEAFEKVASGSLKPVVGPIKDQDGKIMFKKGEVATDNFLFSDWTEYVAGVTASQ